MAFNLLSLLQQGPMSAVGDGMYSDDGSTDIVVQGRPRFDPRRDPEPPQYTDPQMRPEIEPQYILNDNRMQPSPEEMQELLPRKGMFGTKGTLRDILGTLGDAFLVQSGNDRIYAPQRQMEREGDAMFGVTQDPMQAIERLAVHNPPAAQELLQRVQQAQHQQASLASQEAARRSLIEDRAFDNQETGWNRVARWTAAGLPYEQIVAGAQRYGITSDDLAQSGVTADMTPEAREQFSSMDMTTNQIRNIPFTERRVATGEYNAETGRINATRPRQGRAQTDLEYYQEISEIPPQQRTSEQNDFMKKYIQGTRGGSRLGNIAPPPRGEAPKSQFRPVR